MTTQSNLGEAAQDWSRKLQADPHLGEARRSRKLLRVASRSKSKTSTLVSRTETAVSVDEIWQGYEAANLGDLVQAERLALRDFGDYVRPQRVGATGELRLVGGVWIEQSRAKVPLHCPKPGAISRRFQDLSRGLACVSAPSGTPFGFDALLTAVKPDSNDLYDAALRDEAGAFYDDKRGELRRGHAGAQGPFAFFNRSHSFGAAKTAAAFDVFIGSTLSRFAANRLVKSLHLGSFVDSRTSLLRIRIPLHAVDSKQLLDVRIDVRYQGNGQISNTVHIDVISLSRYFKGDPEYDMLFVGELVLVVLCASQFVLSAKTFLRRVGIVLRKRRAERSHVLVVVRGQFASDAMEMCSMLLQLVLPLVTVGSVIVHWVYVFRYVDSFGYAVRYRWYDAVGAISARLLLPKRIGQLPEPAPGQPMGASRFSLPPDRGDHDAFMALARKIDTMRTLSHLHVLMQYPLFVYILFELVRACKRVRSLYPLVRSIERGLTDVAVITLVILVVLVGTAMALSQVLGVRFESCSSIDKCMLALAEYLLGELTPLLRDTLFPRALAPIMLPAELAMLGLVYTIYPLLMTFTLFQFYLAIIVDNFGEERKRARGGESFRAASRTDGEKAVDDAILGVLYWPRLAAAKMALGWSWSRRSSSAGEAAEVPPAAELPPIVKESLSELLSRVRGDRAFTDIHPARRRWKDAKQFAILQARAQSVLAGVNANARFIEDIADGVVDGGGEYEEEVGGGGAVAGAAGGGVASSRNMHQLRFARWLRMNRKHRSEIQLSDLGVIGPVRMLNMISALHASVLARLRDGEKKLEGGLSSSRSASMSNRIMRMISTKGIGGSVSPAEWGNRAGDDDAYRALLLESLSASERAGLVAAGAGTMQLPRSKTMPQGRDVMVTDGGVHRHAGHHEEEVRGRADHEALVRIARRIVVDIGSKPGEEFDRERGAQLAMAVLTRAHDTAIGMGGALRFLEGNLGLLMRALRTLRSEVGEGRRL